MRINASAAAEVETHRDRHEFQGSDGDGATDRALTKAAYGAGTWRSRMSRKPCRKP
jgi:hypothetical protein